VKALPNYSYSRRENNIPIIIFSASGTGSDSIRYFLERYNILFENVIIISNNFEYENGVIKNVIPPIIHALNKNESVLSFFPETRRLILKKKSVLLIGDSVNDVNMVENKNHTNIIRVGILNELNLEKKKEILPFFQEKFDLVVEDDGSLVPIYEVLISKS
jgi:phosphoserine phosphatase